MLNTVFVNPRAGAVPCCSCSGGLGSVGEARGLLDALGVTVLRLPEEGANAHCCGAGGGLYWQDGREPTTPLLAQLGESAAEHCVTACPFCVSLIQSAVTETSPMQVSDLVLWVRRALPGKDIVDEA